jgi:hypothetical protein
MSESPEKAQLYLLIGSKYYLVSRLDVPKEVPKRGWRLTVMSDKGEGFDPYDVVREPSGRLTCTCPDWIVRRQGTGQFCKHETALISVGLLKGNL